MKNIMTQASNETISHGAEISRGERFAFGDNWARFLSVLDDERIAEAENSLKKMLAVESLAGKSFLDIGSGSGLFSLAARRLGATVVSFDYDPQSVACTMELKNRFFSTDANWVVEEGSILDAQYLQRLGKFDVVYSWGVLHHTGAMWTALANVDLNVAENGKLFIALYNYQPFASRYWRFVKKLYNKNILARPFIVFLHLIYPTLPSVVLKKIQRRKNPRGMSTWHDMFDWLGGYPFEVSKPEEIFSFYRKLGYTLEALKTVGGRLGCNEFVFQRKN
ncbi:class I SAM-dependent methyltransferase [Noviherbaspirillum sedimenti]|uniref:Class I SAM-dependent methyltransferase n=1 Tax=Noviherbaspirillum sedimenti TaxID=2320865 RepID=A0A3A3G387_9BURK|nr:class I SAM-dependent methyltransferase [Noviherbaspirillum sedimenti]RJG01279.1 class I SAM-dependent methyltransferase [Noviherbaspirillum sedimenti]